MRRIISFLLILIAIAANARQVSPDEAQSVAAEFFGSSPKHVMANGVKRVAPKDAGTDYQPYYIFNADDNAGFVIVSGDDRARKILGYSDKGEFDFNNLPPQLDWLLNEYGKQIEAIPASASQDPSWQSTDSPAAGEGVLLETANWGQGAPYNAQCPIIDGVQAPTGCVATAMAIVMKYHNWPEQGRSFSTLIAEGVEKTIDFSTFSFDFKKMPTSIDTNSDETIKKEVSSLMLASGRAVNMSYNIEESGAYFEIVAHQLQEKFSYSPDCEFLMGKDFTWDEWTDIIVKELNNNRPVLYGATNINKHSFVCDGYTADNLFHINWGWDGVDNGYFALDDMIYSQSPSIVINITPDKSGVIYARPYLACDGIYTLFEEADAINVSVPNIRTGEPFDINSPTIHTPYRFDGELGFALINDIGEIKEIFCTHRIYGSGLQYFNEYGDGMDFQGFNKVINSQISSDDKIQLVARENENDDWKFILGCSAISSSMPVVECLNRMTTLHIESDPQYTIEKYDNAGIGMSQYNETSFKQIFGSHVDFLFKINDGGNGYGLISVSGKGAYGDENYYMCTNDKEARFAFKLVDDNYYISAKYFEYIAPLNLDIKTAGTLHELISEEQAATIRDLTLSGNINAFDLWFIREHMKGIRRLDLGSTRIIGVDTKGVCINSFQVAEYQPDDTMPDWALESLCLLHDVTLPSSLKSFGNLSLSGLDITKIKLPSSIEDFGFNNFFVCANLEIVENQNTTPIPISDCNFTGTKCPQNGYLIVPEESISAYREAPVWCDFKQIYPIGTILPEEIRFKEPTINIGLNTSEKLSVEFYPANTTIKDLKWECSDENVVSINDDGIIEGLNLGVAEVRAYSSNDKVASCQVVVSYIFVSSIEITPSSVQGVVGDEYKLTENVMPEDATNKAVEWNSDNTEVAEVDANGLVRLLAQGTANITATAADGSGVQAQCPVTVDTPTGIEDLPIEADTDVKIYSTTGVLLFEGRYSDARLDEGIYIVASSDKRFKRLIK